MKQLKQYRITLNGRIYDIQLLSDPRQSPVELKINGELVSVEVEAIPVTHETTDAAPTSASPRSPALQAVAASGKVITVPLPGVIKSVSVQPGQWVAFGDELLTIEAMKMDNIIRAPQEGIIETVHIAEGQRAAHGQPMIEYRR